MDVKKVLKLFYINGTSGGGNKGVLPEKGKRISLVPKRPFGERLNLISDLANIDEMKGKETYLNDVYDDVKGRLIEAASKGRYSWSITELELLNIAGKHDLPEWCGIEQLLIFIKGKCMEDDIRVNITNLRLDLYRIVEFSWNK
ncbi:hypothetical protein DXC22_09095 [Ligilactobacillus salivarius]|uniref:hypothetical protein n=1 Tax=Ligilactobacillus salivarius TaxID=1624 RepID=UPI000E433F55|nr:hypothetical protein [Ligilactobacillus salivarius]RGM22772.1 hypothetical protein DXC22_09095 [Ligilactobacillus salivarius]